MNQDAVKELLRENKVRLSQSAHQAWLGAETFTRYWPNLRREDLDACVAYLKEYTSAKNDTPSQTVEDPFADKDKKLSGIWMNLEVALRFDEERNLALYQTLRAASEGASTGFGSLRSEPRDEDTWLYKDRASAVEAPDSAQGNLYRTTNSLTDEGLYDGTLMYARGTPLRTEFYARQSRFSLAKEIVYRNSWSTITAPPATGTGVYRANNSINDFGMYDGNLVYEFGTGQGQAEFASRRGELRDDDTVIYRDSNSVIDAPDSSQGNIYDARSSLTDRGTYDGSMTYSKATAKKAKFTSLNTAFTTGSQALYRNQKNPVNAPAATGTGIYRATNSLNEFGLYDGSVTYEAGSNAGQAEFASRRGELRDDNTVIYRDSNSVIDAPDSSQGNIYDARSSLTDRGTYDGSMTYSKATAKKAKFTSLNTAFTTGSQALYRNQKNPVNAPAATGTGVYRATNSLNEFGLYDGSVTYEAGSNAGEAEFASRRGELRDDDTVIYRDSNAVISAPNSSQGNIYDARSSLTDRGTYDGSMTYSKATAKKAKFTSLNTAFTTGSQALYRNQKNPVNAPAATGTGVYRATNSLNEFGLYDGSVTYEAGSNSGQASFASRNSELRNDSSVIYRDSNAIIAAPSSGPGAIYDARTSLTDRGTYDGNMTYSKASAKSASFASLNTAFSSGNQTIYRNAEAPIDAPAATGTGVYRAQFSMNEFGLYDGSVIYEGGTNGGQASFASRNSELRNDSSVIYRDSNAIIAAPSSGPGAIYDARTSLTDRGTYDGSMTYSKASAKNANFNSLKTPFTDGSETIYRNQGAPVKVPASHTGTGIYQANNQINEFGLYDGRITFQSGNGGGSAKFASRNSELRNDSSIVYRESDSVIAAPSSGPGAIYDARSNLNDRGTYDGNMTYSKASAKSASFASLNTAFSSGNQTIYRNAEAPIDAPAASGTGVYRAQFSMNEFGLYDGTVIYEGGTNGGQASFASRSSQLRDDTSVVYRDSNAIIAAPSSSQGVIYDARSSLTDRGTYDGSMTYSKANVAAAEFTSLNTAFSTGTETLYRNRKSPIDAPAASGTGIYQASNSINEFGLYDGRITYQAGNNSGQASFASRNSELRNDSSVIYRDSNAIIGAPSSGPGAIYDARSSLTDRGTYDGNMTYSKASAKSASFASLNTAFSSGNETIYRNAAGPVDAPAATGTGIYRARFSMNEFGLYDGSVIYEGGTSGGQAAFASRSSELRDDNSVIYRESNAVIAAPSSAPGAIYDARTSLTDRGTYDGSMTYSEAHSKSASFTSLNSAFASGNQTIYRNADGPIDAPSSTGTGLYRAQFSMNEFGLYDGSIVYEAGTGGGQASFTSRHSPLVVDNSVVYRDSNEIISAPSSSAGVIYDARSSLTDRGTYDGSMTHSEAAAAGVNYTVSSIPGGGTTAQIYRNLAAIPSASANTANNIYSRGFSINEFGLYDGTIQHRITDAQSFGAFTSARDGGQPEQIYIYQNTSVPPEVPAGFLGRANMQRNQEDGTWNGELRIRDDSSGINWLIIRDWSWSFSSSQNETVTVAVRYTSSISDAENHCTSSGGGVVVGARDGHKTGIQIKGANFRAQRVEVS